MNLPHFVSTYDEYLWLREQLGYEHDLAMMKSVWEGCDPAAQEYMLQQFRKPVWDMQMRAEEQTKRRERYGDAW